MPNNPGSFRIELENFNGSMSGQDYNVKVR